MLWQNVPACSGALHSHFNYRFSSVAVRWRNLRNYTFPFECAAATEKAKWEANAEEDAKYAAKNSFTESFVRQESL